MGGNLPRGATYTTSDARRCYDAWGGTGRGLSAKAWDDWRACRSWAGDNVQVRPMDYQLIGGIVGRAPKHHWGLFIAGILVGVVQDLHSVWREKDRLKDTICGNTYLG